MVELIFLTQIDNFQILPETKDFGLFSTQQNYVLTNTSILSNRRYITSLVCRWPSFVHFGSIYGHILRC